MRRVGRSLDQVEAFCDMWTLTPEREREIRHMPILVRETGIDDEVAEFWKVWLNALRKTNPALLAYLSYMVIRLAHMRVLLRPTGSLYLHCDPTAAQLHQGHSRRRVRARQLPQRDRLVLPEVVNEGEPVRAESRRDPDVLAERQSAVQRCSTCRCRRGL